ncbi:RNA-binding domain-containing protein [Mollisia scopiformis]|uniref:RNA-binding domain-containing protein n=1 Tax=Mollisia scopiformis TaxID=149040 RepID=A0A194X6C7_MOLSC|nr:RNA-binding domain-containing protein [Mollisia scopiformis]KUJ15728.1 RNA-binding domain-containing protein [Mollisia scopiformis]
MADNDNFEEDLFADLYTDDVAPKAAAPEPEVKPEVTEAAEVKVEESHEHGAENGDGDEQMYNGEQDMEDEIDFNLGNGNSYDTPGSHEAHGPVSTRQIASQKTAQILENGVGELGWEALASHPFSVEIDVRDGKGANGNLTRGGKRSAGRNSFDYAEKFCTTSNEAKSSEELDCGGQTKDTKMFIGGLNWETTDQSLKEYFSQFGEVLECTVMRDGASGRSRGFGFLTFKDARTVNIVMVKEHYLDGKIVRPDFSTKDNSLRRNPSTLLSPIKHSSSCFTKIDPKRAIPRDEQERTSKIFVGGVSQEATEQDFKEYFMQFGRVVDATLMMDKDTGRPRGFGFVTFDSEAAVDQCLAQPLEILGKPIEVKKAQPRGNMREEEEPRNIRGGGRFRKGNENESQNANQVQQGGGNQMAPGGMTPQLMAQYWQRMQQYFAMMQQNMAMGGGRGMAMGGMNPQMMMQMQQMQQMQQQMSQGNRSQSPQSPGAAMGGMQGMNPAMLAQMQQMQQMQMQGMGGGAGAMGGAGFGGANAASNPGGRMGTPGYNAYEQQVFEQQKYEQQQMRRAQRDQSQYSQGGGGGYGMGGGGPTSWEGMYDDVPQPAVPASNSGGSRGGRGGSRGSQPPQTPASAPPANAPTGPKNAGKPGANYRGGGRGQSRGFHPYAR